MDENTLFRFAFSDDPTGIEQAIRAGADPNAVHPRGGHTPLQVAAQEDSTKALGALLAGGADPNLRFTWVSRVDGRVFPGRVALMYAASGNVVERLVSSGAALDAADQSGWTAVACAIEAISVDAFKMLLQAGASLDVMIELNGKTASLIDLVDDKSARIVAVAGARPNSNAVHMLESLAAIRTDLVRRAGAGAIRGRP
jgi:ankyrin repeat protein